MLTPPNNRLHGSYEALEGGQAMDALVDLTGGLAESYSTLNGTEFYMKIQRAHSHGSFITCSRKVCHQYCILLEAKLLVKPLEIILLLALGSSFLKAPC